MSVYAKRSDSAVYYMSKEFSDYFKQDLKEFCDKFSLLHPKIKCNNKKIKKLLFYSRASIHQKLLGIMLFKVF